MKTICLLVIFQTYFEFTKNHEWEPRIALPSQCGKKEYYNECGSSCKIDCYTSQISMPCKSHTCAPGCYCKGSFYRNGRGGACVKAEHCLRIRGRNKHNQKNKEEILRLLSDMLMEDTKERSILARPRHYPKIKFVRSRRPRIIQNPIDC